MDLLAEFQTSCKTEDSVHAEEVLFAGLVKEAHITASEATNAVDSAMSAPEDEPDSVHRALSSR